MDIRTATSNDAPLLAQLNQPVHQIHAQAHPEYFKSISPDDPALIAFYDQMLTDPNTVIYIAEIDQTPVGYIVARILYRPESVFAYEMNTVYIDQISVNPDYRKQGCGETLIQSVFALARELGISRVTLDVWDFNENAQQFFAKQGFKTFNYRMDTDV